MLTISLLPPEQKKEYKMELNRRLIVFYSIGLLTIIGIFIGLLFSITVYLDIQNDALNQQIIILETAPKAKEIRGLELAIKDFSNLLSKARTIKASLYAFHPFFRDINSIMPQGVYVNTLSVDRQTQKASLTGFAPTRAEVIGFKDGLGKLPWVKLVDSPLSNLIKERNINFSFTIDLKLQ